MSTKSKARTAASGMGRRAQRQGAGHGAAQLTFDDEEDDREEEGGLHTGGARTHLACCGRLRANPIQLQLPSFNGLRQLLLPAAMRSRPP